MGSSFLLPIPIITYKVKKSKYFYFDGLCFLFYVRPFHFALSVSFCVRLFRFIPCISFRLFAFPVV